MHRSIWQSIYIYNNMVHSFKQNCFKLQLRNTNSCAAFFAQLGPLLVKSFFFTLNFINPVAPNICIHWLDLSVVYYFFLRLLYITDKYKQWIFFTWTKCTGPNEENEKLLWLVAMHTFSLYCYRITISALGYRLLPFYYYHCEHKWFACWFFLLSLVEKLLDEKW